ncbi:MAG TPA: lytic murein transglycosylase [Candidatus Paceibacterota bacterium]|nr:lytic murein transglycosylase [Candidatus Paceibacterota bacterium]
MVISYNALLKKISLVLVCAVLVVVPVFSCAADDDEDDEQDKIEERERELQKELDAKMKEIAAISVFANQKSQERASLERDVALLEAEIKKTQLQIQARNISIKQLGGEISERGNTLTALQEKYERQKASLSELLRATNKIDDYSLVEVALSKQNISEFFRDLDSFDSINNAIQGSFRDIKVTKATTEAEKQSLEVAHTKEVDLKYLQEIEKQKIEAREAEKEYVLDVTKGQESVYNQILEQKRAEAARISAQIFALRDTEGIQFGDALEYAREASKLTGVRTAFLLGILKQETNIGNNLGSCVVSDLDSGETRSVTTGTTFANGIHPTRDLPVFQSLMKTLGRDPLSTKVSCPLASGGYGGAMGPSQFIPSTWNGYIGRLQGIVGVYPNPWNPRHAFIASAVFLADLGAAAGGYSAEHQAAARYYAGGNWKSLGQGYANNVLSHAQTIQTTMIDPIEDAEDEN